MYSVSDETRKPIFEGVQGENEAREIQFDVTAWVEELGEGVCTATAKRPTDTTPYPVTVTRSGNVVTWKPNSTDTSIEGIGAFQLAFSINDVVAKTRIWNTKIAPSLVGAGDPPDPYDDWIQDLRGIAAETLTYSQNAENSADDAEAEKLESEAWAKGTKNGTPVPSTADQYQNNSKYWAEQSLANQYGAYIVKSASGDIASFTDGADNVPMKSLNVTITPKQSGSGDPSPSNVRPITGTSTANVFVTGTNIWDEDWEIGAIQLTDGANAANASRIRSKNYIPALPNTDYYIGAEASVAYTSWLIVCFYDADKNFISGISPSINRVFTTPSNTRFVRFSTSDVWGGRAYTGGICVNYPSTDHEYHPYTGTTTMTALGRTVYGGEVDVVSGEMTLTHKAVTLNGTEGLTYNAGYGGGLYYDAEMDAHGLPVDDFLCDRLVGAPARGGAGARPTIKTYSNTSDKQYFFVCPPDAVTDTENMNTWLASNPTTVVYPITPTTVQLTPTEVRTLLGTNNVWADCGDIAVEYRADPTLAYNELANVIVSLGGNL